MTELTVACVINGWTATGSGRNLQSSRVSDGALIAPLAVLGPHMIVAVAEAFTEGASQLSANWGARISLLGQPDIRRYVACDSLTDLSTPDFWAQIARRATLSGRRLFIRTPNLDAQRGVVWDMGRYASSGTCRMRGEFSEDLCCRVGELSRRLRSHLH